MSPSVSLPSVRVHFADSGYDYDTSVSAGTTAEQARDYFVGQELNLGVGLDDVQTCTGITFTALVDPWWCDDCADAHADDVPTRIDAKGRATCRPALWRCPECKSHDVVTLTWVNVNTRCETDDDDEEVAYRCEHCDWQSKSDLDLVLE